MITRILSSIWLRGAAIGLCMALLVFSGALEGVERWGLSLLFNLRGPLLPQTPVVIVSIDEDSFDELDLVWPWPRALHARFLDIVSRGKPAVVGFDVLFAEPSARGPEDDRTFAEAIGRAGNVLLAAALTVVDDTFYTKQDLNAPIRPLRERALGFGAVNFLVDDDAVVREVDLGRQYQDKELPQFDRALYRAAAQAGIPARPLDQGRFFINYRGGPKTFPVVPYHRVLNGEIAPDLFAGRIVLVGATSPVLHDLYPTPFATQGDMPGVEIHANVLETLLQGLAIRRVSQPVILSLVLLAGVVAVWVTNRLRPLSSLGVVLVLAGAYTAVSFALFVRERLWLDVIAVPVGLVVGYGVTVVENIIQEQRKRALLMKLFSRHVSTEVAETIWAQREQFMDGGRLRSQKLTATVLFTDLAGYTTVAEKMDPQSLMDWINNYLETMVALVIKYQGVVDDYAGDAIKADFGVPLARTTEAEIRQDAINAVNCALAMEVEIMRLNNDFRERQLPMVAMRVGIATGSVVAGSLGGKQRLKYTTLGDMVNVAARLEGFEKELVDPLRFPCRILVDEGTASYVKGHVEMQRVGEAHLKGKASTRTVYRVLGWADRSKAVLAGIEGRRAARATMNGVVDISDDQVTIHASIRDLSQTGLSVQDLTLKVTKNQMVQLRLTLPDVRKPILASGRVVWSDGDKAGFQFLDIQLGNETIIEEFVARQKGSSNMSRKKNRLTARLLAKGGDQ